MNHAQKILITANRIGGNFTLATLAVHARRLFPEDFSLEGQPSTPDVEAIRRRLDGKDGLAQAGGLFEQSKGNRLSLTSKGVSEALVAERELRRSQGVTGNLPDALADLVAGSRSMPKNPGITDLGVAMGFPPSTIERRSLIAALVAIEDQNRSVYIDAKADREAIERLWKAASNLGLISPSLPFRALEQAAPPAAEQAAAPAPARFIAAPPAAEQAAPAAEQAAPAAEQAAPAAEQAAPAAEQAAPAAEQAAPAAEQAAPAAKPRKPRKPRASQQT